MNTTGKTVWLKATLCGLLAAMAVASTGCQITVGGQTLPSPYYIEDDVQYFNPGPEFILPREAAFIKQQRAEEALRNSGGLAP